MKNSYTVLAALCAALLAAGCGGGKKPAPREYRPLVPQGACAVGVSEAESLNASAMAAFLRAEQQRQLEAAERFAEKHPERAQQCSSQALKKLQDILSDFGKDVKWSVASFARPSFSAETLKGDDSVIEVPACVGVVCLKEPTTLEAQLAKAEQIATTLRDSMDLPDGDGGCDIFCQMTNYVAVTDAEIAGCKVRKVSVIANEDTQEFLNRVKGWEPCVGVFDGVLLIAATSPEAFADTVALYKGEAPAADPESEIAKDAALTGTPRAFFGLYDCDTVVDGLLEGSDAADDNDDAMSYLKALKTVKLFAAMDDTAMKETVGATVAFADAGSATALSGLIEGGKGFATMMLGMAAHENAGLADVVSLLNGFTSKVEGSALAVQLDIPKSVIEKLNYDALLELQEKYAPQLSGDDDEDDEDDDSDDGDDEAADD